MSNHTTHDTSVKLCECGCGQPTPNAKTTDPRFGHIKGQPLRFIRGHNQRGVSRPRTKTPIAERFWRHVAPGRFDECWLWQGATNRVLGGYGVMGVDDKMVYAHRVSWELHNGPIPSGVSVLHKCDNPRCCNPYHLFLGTQQDNITDMIAKGRQTSSEIRSEQSKGEMNPRHKLTSEQVRAIRRRAADGEQQSDLAKEYGVHKTGVSSIVLRKTWKHV